MTLTLWTSLVSLLAGPWPSGSGLSGATVTALAVTILVGALVVCLAHAPTIGRISAAAPLLGRASALRAKSRRAAFLRQRDPDAAGRPRPRAPSAAPAAA